MVILVATGLVRPEGSELRSYDKFSAARRYMCKCGCYKLIGARRCMFIVIVAG